MQLKKFAMVCQVWILVNMNSIEKEECEKLLGTSDGVTMEDYFNHIHAVTQVPIDNIKTEFKSHYSDETNWSF